MKRRRIYFDYAASTPLDSNALKAMMPYLKREFGNPSSAHGFGQAPRAAIEEARERVAEFLGAAPEDIVFTSGATEANNLAIQGAVFASKEKKPHIVASSFEHESVLGVIKELERRGSVETTYVEPTGEGIVEAGRVEKALKRNTVFVSVMYVNSEIGTVQPVEEIGKMLQKAAPQALFHVDAVQAAPFLDCNTARISCHFMTLSSHKLYGPKGAGALFVKKGVSLTPFLYGGGQERAMRSGTENVASLVGFGAAVREAANGRTAIANVKIRHLRDRMLKGMMRAVPGVELNGSLELRVPSNINVRVEGVAARELAQVLDTKGIAVATGSACTERSQEPSHVLLSLGLSRQEALSSFRITLGKHTMKEEVEKFLKVFPAVVSQLRI
ncbi:cysteine desulfurase [Patescibacteria group bacterium]|nr:cysteine desulfurase [Patescibacteria group bacterium]